MARGLQDKYPQGKNLEGKKMKTNNEEIFELLLKEKKLLALS